MGIAKKLNSTHFFSGQFFPLLVFWVSSSSTFLSRSQMNCFVQKCIDRQKFTIQFRANFKGRLFCINAVNIKIGIAANFYEFYSLANQYLWIHLCSNITSRYHIWYFQFLIFHFLLQDRKQQLLYNLCFPGFFS